MRTVAPLTTAPEGSVTVPVMLPPETCAAADAQRANEQHIATIIALKRDGRDAVEFDFQSTEYPDRMFAFVLALLFLMGISFISGMILNL
jgi:hypothetical protein